MDTADTTLDIAAYTGKVPEELRDRAIRAYNTYKSDRYTLMERIKDDESFYRSYYSHSVSHLKKHMHAETPFIFSCIENAQADAAESYPIPNILEREQEGEETAQMLTKILPVQLERSKFNKVYKQNTLNKLKYGTAVYGVFYNAQTEELDIRSVDITDIYVDMYLDNVQDSSFMFISAVIDNEVLKQQYPRFKSLFCDDSEIETLTGSHKLDSKTKVLDCYYKKADGTLHMMKLCKGTIIAATEDMEGYENGLYDHGQYPVVFDVLYPQKNCPFGFGMLDIGKALQIGVDRLDRSITENVVETAKPRYLSKRNGGINEKEFADFNTQVVHYEGDGDSLKEIQTTQISSQFITYRETKIDELKEILSNRDFQQGQTSGGVTAASAIETLRQTGEKRSRKMIDDSYDAYKEIVYMAIELIRQFYDNARTFRIEDDKGGKDFVSFSNAMMNVADGTEEYEDEETGEARQRTSYRPIQFDVEVVPQQENPFTREMNNNTILSLWNSGFFLPQNLELSAMALQHMNFNGSNKLIGDISSYAQQLKQQQIQQAQPQQTTPVNTGQSGSGGEELIPVDLNSGGTAMQSSDQSVNSGSLDELLPLQITGGAPTEVGAPSGSFAPVGPLERAPTEVGA